MKPNIQERLAGIESIIHRLRHNIELIEFLSFNLHKEAFSLNNNVSLFWIWKSLLAGQIIDFYKLSVTQEKFSFQKLINIAKEQKQKINYEDLEKMLANLVSDYDKHKFEVVRSKYLAHQDLNAAAIETNILSVREFTNKSVSMFSLLAKEFNWEKLSFSRKILSSFKEIFDRVDEYEKVSAYLIATKLKGEKSVKISELEKIIK